MQQINSATGTRAYNANFDDDLAPADLARARLRRLVVGGHGCCPAGNQIPWGHGVYTYLSPDGD